MKVGIFYEKEEESIGKGRPTRDLEEKKKNNTPSKKYEKKKIIPPLNQTALS